MLRLASDADVHGEIIRGLRQQSPKTNIDHNTFLNANYLHYVNA